MLNEILGSSLLPFFSTIIQVAGRGLNTSQALDEILRAIRRKSSNINLSREILGLLWAGYGPIGPKRLEKMTLGKAGRSLFKADLYGIIFVACLNT